MGSDEQLNIQDLVIEERGGNLRELDDDYILSITCNSQTFEQRVCGLGISTSLEE